MEQSPRVLAMLPLLANADTVIEIGSRCGGFLKLLDDQLPGATPIVSIDIEFQHRADIDLSERVTLRQGSCFDLVEDVASIIESPGRTIVLCDGGDKIKEVRTFCGRLKVGDRIMAHDYAPTPAHFASHVQGRIWDFHEIWDAAIRDALLRAGCRQRLEATYQNAAWGCWQRVR